MRKVKSGVGYVDITDSLEAGRKCAEKAMGNGSMDRSDFTVAFCGGNHDPINFLKAVRDVVGDLVLVDELLTDDGGRPYWEVLRGLLADATRWDQRVAPR